MLILIANKIAKFLTKTLIVKKMQNRKLVKTSKTKSLQVKN